MKMGLNNILRKCFKNMMRKKLQPWRGQSVSTRCNTSSMVEGNAALVMTP